MKKAIVISAFMLTCLTVFESCKKSEEAIIAPTETAMAVALKTNQIYTYTLPVVDEKQAYKIVETSLQNGTANIVADASGNMQLVFTPDLNYVGTGMVALSTQKEGQCNGKKPEHKEKGHLPLPLKPKRKHHKPHLDHTITINFNITSDETIATVN